MKKSQLKHVLKVINDLTQNNKTTTTLDVKTQLLAEFPNEKWFQSDVSDIMDDLAKNNLLTYTFNGTYRTYTKVVNTQAPVQTTVPGKLNRTQIVQAIRDSGFKFITVTFIKKDKSVRTMNCQVSKNDFYDTLGYIKAHTKAGLRRIDPREIKAVKIKGNLLEVK